MKEYCLADLIDIKHGFAFDGEHITSDDNGIVLVTPGNFKIGGGFQEDKCKYFNGDIPEEFVLKPGAYIVTMTDLSKGIDTLGYTAIVPKNAKRTYLHNQRIGLISFLSDECDKDYLYYLMQSHDYQREIANTSTGSTVHHTSPSRIRNYKFLAPDIQIQRFIAKTLRTYDDLIENNQKQIKLLEEAAQRLYKEWFVDLCFPGHETTRVVDGVPEGWRKETISDICDTIGGGTPSTSKPEYYSDGTIRWVTPTDLTKANSLILLDSEKKITIDGLNNSSAKLLPPYTILMTSRASIGFFALCEFEVCTNQGFISCVPCCEEMRYYLLFNLMERVDEIKGKATGSTFLEISKRTFRDMEIIVPNNELLLRFTTIIDPIIKEQRTLTKIIAHLQQARDRLLPKLMSGELEV